MDLKSLIATRLNDHLDELRSFIDGLTPEQLAEHSPDSPLSLAGLALHLMEVQEEYIHVISRMVLGERPVFDPSVLDKHPQDSVPMSDINGKLKDFDDQRRSLVSLLNALSEDHWRMEGDHPDIPHYSLEKCMEELMRHEEYHLFQMYRLFFGVRHPV